MIKVFRIISMLFFANVIFIAILLVILHAFRTNETNFCADYGYEKQLRLYGEIYCVRPEGGVVPLSVLE